MGNTQSDQAARDFFVGMGDGFMTVATLGQNEHFVSDLANVRGPIEGGAPPPPPPQDPPPPPPPPPAPVVVAAPAVVESGGQQGGQKMALPVLDVMGQKVDLNDPTTLALVGGSAVLLLLMLR